MMSDLDMTPLAPPAGARVARLGAGVLLRAALAFLTLAAVGALTLPARAEGPMRLRGDVTARADVITLGDLVDNAPATLAARPLFRAPALGATGTIQARRILEAVAGAGAGPVETGGRVQVSVQRAARRVEAAEIEAAVKRGLAAAYALDPASVSVRLDGEAPILLAPADLAGQAVALDLTYDPRSRRIGAIVGLGERQASLRIAGTVIALREVAVLLRPINRGERVQEADVSVERRPRESLPADALTAPAPGEVAQRSLSQGAVLRAGDTAPPELVARGEAVAILYEAPGISLSMRGIANEPGRLGATVNVLNTASKKILQAVVVGPGRVSVGPSPAAQRQASAAAATTLR